MIPLPSTLIGLVCSAVWFGYGLMLSDPAIIVPNGLGVLFSFINMITIVIYRNKDVDDIQKLDNSYKSIENENEKKRKPSDI